MNLGAGADRPAPPPDTDFDVVEGDGIVIVGPGPTVHRLNLTAMAVWLACDGDTSIAEAADRVAEQFHVVGDQRRKVDVQVTELVDQMVAVGLLHDGRGVDGDTTRSLTSPCDAASTVSDRAVSGAHHLLVPESPCRESLERTGWTSTIALDVPTGPPIGVLRLGVRTDTPSTARWVQDRFPDLVTDDATAPPNLRVVRDRSGPGGPSAGRRDGVYEGHRWVSEASDDETLGRLLDVRLAGLVPLGGDQSHLVRFTLAAELTPSGAVLSPWVPYRPGGLTASTIPPPVLVDSERGVVVHPDPRLASPGRDAGVLPIAGIEIESNLGRLPMPERVAALARSLHLAPTESVDGMLSRLVTLARRLGS